MTRTCLVVLATAALMTACDGGPTAPSKGPPLDIQSATSTVFQTGYIGQSVTIQGNGAFRELVFNWFDAEGPVAFGRLILLGEEFLGVPADLGPAQPRFMAWSQTTSGGFYIFPPDVTVNAGERYWFYSSERGNVLSDRDDGAFPGGDMYMAGTAVSFFVKAPTTAPPLSAPPRFGYRDANFRLRGTAVK